MIFIYGSLGSHTAIKPASLLFCFCSEVNVRKFGSVESIIIDSKEDFHNKVNTQFSQFNFIHIPFIEYSNFKCSFAKVPELFMILRLMNHVKCQCPMPSAQSRRVHM